MGKIGHLFLFLFLFRTKVISIPSVPGYWILDPGSRRRYYKLSWYYMSSWESQIEVKPGFQFSIYPFETRLKKHFKSPPFAFIFIEYNVTVSKRDWKKMLKNRQETVYSDNSLDQWVSKNERQMARALRSLYRTVTSPRGGKKRRIQTWEIFESTISDLNWTVMISQWESTSVGIRRHDFRWD